jgi:hypothetical protein
MIFMGRKFEIRSAELVQSFLPVLDGMITGGLVTMEKIRALHYRGAVSGRG